MAGGVASFTREWATMTTGSARRIGRWVLIGLAGLAVLVVLLRIGAGFYLRSSHGRAVVAEQLTSMIGLPVEVSAVELGSSTSPSSSAYSTPTS
jgi:hypothetical protein